MSELPLSGEVRAVHATVIEESANEEMVGALIVSGILLILAPVVVVVDQSPFPIEFMALTLTATKSSKARENGLAVKVSISIVHESADITVVDDPSHSVVVWYAPKLSTMLIS